MAILWTVSVLSFLSNDVKGRVDWKRAVLYAVIYLQFPPTSLCGQDKHVQLFTNALPDHKIHLIPRLKGVSLCNFQLGSFRSMVEIRGIELSKEQIRYLV